MSRGGYHLSDPPGAHPSPEEMFSSQFTGSQQDSFPDSSGPCWQQIPRCHKFLCAAHLSAPLTGLAMLSLGPVSRQAPGDGSWPFSELLQLQLPGPTWYVDRNSHICLSDPWDGVKNQQDEPCVYSSLIRRWQSTHPTPAFFLSSHSCLLEGSRPLLKNNAPASESHVLLS